MKIAQFHKFSKAFIKRNVERMHKDQYPNQPFLKKDLVVMGKVNGDFKSSLHKEKTALPPGFAILTHKGWVYCIVKTEKIGTPI